MQFPENVRPTDNDAAILRLCNGATAVVNPIATILGGIVGQEVRANPVLRLFL